MPVGPQPVDLDECAGQLFRFPRRAGFARAQPDSDILDPHRLPWAKRQVADDSVALVEQAEDRDALRHRRDPRLLGGGAGYVDRDRLVCVLFGLASPFAARRHQQDCNRKKGLGPGHAWSGFHAS